MHHDEYMQYRRKSFRLHGYDYRNEGMYFVTICTKDRYLYFGQIEQDKMILSDIGEIVYKNWLLIPELSPHIVLDEFVIMPNHIHGILAIVTDVASLPVASLQCNDATTSNNPYIKNEFMANISPKSGSISRVLNSYKGACTKEIRGAFVATLQCNDATNNNDATGNNNNATIIKTRDDAMAFGWQPKFHDRIIRDDAELQRIRHYIIQNPANWQNDENFEP